MNLFKRTPDPLPTYADAEQYRAAGYQTLAIERTQVELGQREEPTGGGWAYPIGDPSHPEQYTVGIHAGIFPRNGGGTMTLAQCAATWLAVLRVQGLTNRRAAKDIDAVLAPVVGESAVRTTVDTLDLLIPFRVDVSDPRAVHFRAGEYGHGVTITSGAVCFVADGGPFKWRDQTLLTVPRDVLPLLTLETARDIINECDRVLAGYRPPVPPTALQLRLEAARRRAQLEPDTVEEA